MTLAVGLAVMPTLAVACGDDEKASTTLPPIVTTTTTTTLLITTTTVQQFYEVQPGDTLSKIAEHFGVDIDDLMAVNGITDPDHIEVGEELEIPPAKNVAETLPSTTSTSTTLG